MDRAFLRDLARPFAPDRLWAFLRGNRWVFASLAVAASLRFAFGSFLAASGAQSGDSFDFTLLDPGTFDITKTEGYPGRALDIAGDLAPIVAEAYSSGRYGFTWALWSRSRNRAILFGKSNVVWNGLDSFPSHLAPQFIFGAARNEIIVSVDVPGRGPWIDFNGARKVLLFDADSGRLKRVCEVPGLYRVTDVSPSGRLVAGEGYLWIDDHLAALGNRASPVGSFFMQPVILDLDSGQIRKETIQLAGPYFENEERLICLRYNAVVRYELNTRSARDLAVLHEISLSWIHQSFVDPRLRRVVFRHARGVGSLNLDGSDGFSTFSILEILGPSVNGSGTNTYLPSHENPASFLNPTHRLIIVLRMIPPSISATQKYERELLLVDLNVEPPHEIVLARQEPYVAGTREIPLEKRFGFVTDELLARADLHGVEFVPLAAVLDEGGERK